MTTNFIAKLFLAGAFVMTGFWASAQTGVQQVTVAQTQGNKVFLDIDARLLQTAIDSLFSSAASSSSQTLSSILSNGGNPGADMNFYSYDIINLGDLGASGTLTADSLVLNKDAQIAGTLNVTGVTTLGDSLIVSGYAEFADSLEVVKAVTIGETLFVTGVTSLGDSLHVVGNVDFDALFNVDGAATFGSTLSVAGKTTLNDSLIVNSGANITGTLYVDSLSVTDVINGQVSSLANHDTDGLSEGSTNLYFTDARARAAISEGTGVTITNGQIAIGQAVSTTSDVTFDELYADSVQATGTLTVSGITTLNDSLYVEQSVEIDGNLIVNGSVNMTSADFAGGTASGSRAFARGYNALASGPHSMALDSLAVASGISSKAIGRESAAVATDAVALGFNSDAADPSMWSSAGYGWHAMAFGAGSSADGSHSFALGENSTVHSSAYHGMALGHGSTVNILTHFGIAFGQNSNAGGGAGSMAFGMGSKTIGASSFSMAFGQNATAGGVSSMAFGSNSTTNMFHAMAFGYNSTASGPSSLAMGESSTASGWSSRAFGPSSSATAANAYALGQNAAASGYNSLAFGPSSTATTGNAIAFGEGADAKAWNSYALGYNSETNGSQSFVQAAESNANSLHQVILGAYADATPFSSADALNWVETDPLVVIGNGSSTSDRTNAFVMLKDGSAMFSDSLHVGRNLDVTGTLDISGQTSLNDSLHVNSGANISATLYADSISTPGLNVTENLTFTDGNQGAGKVLTSDANGNAYWATASSGGGATYTAGTGVDLTNDVISIGQAVSTTSDVTFDELDVDSLQATGTLNVAGITTLSDSLLVNSGADINATLYADSIHTPGLNVSENFTFTDGSEGAGKVLTSDANGNAYWATASSGGGSTYTAGTGIDITENVISVSPAEETTCTGTTLNYNGVDYNLIEIGGVCWFVDDLATTKFQDGTDITVAPGMNCGFGVDPCWGPAAYGTDYSEAMIIWNQEAFYSWTVASNTTNGGVCPSGWHIATEGDWNALANQFGGMAEAADDLYRTNDFDGFGYGYAGYTDNWLPPSDPYYETYFMNGGSGDAYWWLPTESGGNGNALVMSGSGTTLSTGTYDKAYGMQVRCVKDGGVIGSGVTNINEAASGLAELQARVDALEALHVPEPSICDNGTITYNGADYNLVEIDGVCWFAEDLASAQYADGTFLTIPTLDCGYAEICWGPYATTDLSASWIDRAPALHYSFGAVTNTENGGLCPTGWHVSSAGDWANAVEHFGGEALAPNSLLDPSGFAALTNGATDYRVDQMPGEEPTGSRLGVFPGNGTTANYWLPIEVDADSAYAVSFTSTDPVSTISVDKYWGLPVRCVENETSNAANNINTFENVTVSGDLIVQNENLMDIIAAMQAELAALAAGSGGAASRGCGGETTLTYHEVPYNLTELQGVCWFMDDLKAKNFNTGERLYSANSDIQLNPSDPWGNANSSAAYYDYAGLTVVYDYYALTSDKLCPKGWHVPSVDDWNDMLEFGTFGVLTNNYDYGYVFSFDAALGASNFGWGLSTSVNQGEVRYGTYSEVSTTGTPISGASTRCVKD